MKRSYTLVCFVFAFPLHFFAQSYYTVGVTFFNDTLQLYAEVFIPVNSAGQSIGVAVIQGSGASGTDNAWARSFAEQLAGQGIYVLLPDKRGVGKSQGDWKTASFEELAADAAASARYLQSEYSLEKVGVMGLSQGGVIVPVAAAQENGVGFVIDIVGSAVPFEDMIIHEVVNTSLREGLGPEEVRKVLELHVLMKEFVITGDWGPLEAQYKELKASAWADYARTFPQDKDSWVWGWIRLNFDFDPLQYWAAVKQPAFIAYGARDEHDNVPVWRSVYRLQSVFAEKQKGNFEIHVYDTGHAMYQSDKAELHKGFVADLLKWIKEVK